MTETAADTRLHRDDAGSYLICVPWAPEVNHGKPGSAYAKRFEPTDDSQARAHGFLQSYACYAPEPFKYQPAGTVSEGRPGYSVSLWDLFEEFDDDGDDDDDDDEPEDDEERS